MAEHCAWISARHTRTDSSGGLGTQRSPPQRWFPLVYCGCSSPTCQHLAPACPSLIFLSHSHPTNSFGSYYPVSAQSKTLTDTMESQDSSLYLRPDFSGLLSQSSRLEGLCVCQNPQATLMFSSGGWKKARWGKFLPQSPPTWDLHCRRETTLLRHSLISTRVLWCAEIFSLLSLSLKR